MKKIVSTSLKTAVQVVLSACLVWLVFRQLDWDRIGELFRHPGGASESLVALLLVFLLFNASKVLGAQRLNLYQARVGIRWGALENLKLYYASMFFNLVLPGGIGGDGFKILVQNRQLAVPVRVLLRLTLVDRIGGLLVLSVLLALFTLQLELPPAAVDALHRGAMHSTLPLACLVGLAVSAFVALHAMYFPLTIGVLLGVAGCGLGMQLLQLACMGILLGCLQIRPGELAPFLTVFLLSSVAAVLPLSVGGLGAREFTFLYGLRSLGLDPTAGVLAASVFFAITALSSMVGLLFVGGFSLRRKPGISGDLT